MVLQLFEGDKIRFAAFDADKDPAVFSKWTHDPEYMRLVEYEPVVVEMDGGVTFCRNAADLLGVQAAIGRIDTPRDTIAHDAGVPIVAGTDEGIPGHSVHREIELYVEAGLTPMQALQAATIVPARAMKLDAEAGTIERGKRADLVVLNANPLDSIRNIRTVRWTIRSGRVYDAPALWRSVRVQP